MIREWVARILGGRRFRVVREAATWLERAQLLQHENHRSEALAAARKGLELLDDPGAGHRWAAEATVLVGLTTLAEEIGQELGEPGARRQDLVATLAILGRLSDAVATFPDLAAREPTSSHALRLKWIPYLEARLAGEANDHS